MKSGVNTHVHQHLSGDQGIVRVQVLLGTCTGLACKHSHPSVSTETDCRTPTDTKILRGSGSLYKMVLYLHITLHTPSHTL